MRIAVTSQNRREITAHAGKCRFFWIYDCQENIVTTKQDIINVFAFNFANAIEHSLIIRNLPYSFDEYDDRIDLTKIYMFENTPLEHLSF